VHNVVVILETAIRTPVLPQEVIDFLVPRRMLLVEVVYEPFDDGDR